MVVAHWLRWKAVLVGVEVPASGRVQHAWGGLSTASLRPPQNPTLPCHRPSLSTLHLPARSAAQPASPPGAFSLWSLVAAPVPSLSSHNPVISSTPRLSRPRLPPPQTQDQVPFTYPPEFPATGFTFSSFFSPLPSHSFATPIDNGSRLAQGSWLESFPVHRHDTDTLTRRRRQQHPQRRRRRHDDGATTTTSSWLDDRFSFFLSSRTPSDNHPSSFVQPTSNTIK